MTNMTTLLLLAHRYQAAATVMLNQLKSHLEIDGPLLWAVRRRPIPRTGIFNGYTYQIHGGGVVIFSDNVAVDIELGENDYAGAFDAWRLVKYAEHCPEFKKLTDVKVVQSMLTDALNAGEICTYPYLGHGFYTLEEPKNPTESK